jgi:hypothetical protein
MPASGGGRLRCAGVIAPQSHFMPMACQPVFAKNALIYYNFSNS